VSKGWENAWRIPVFLSVDMATQTKKRGEFDAPPRFKMIGQFTQGVTFFVARGSSRMVGIKPILGLPTDPCALDIRMVDSEVVPQQSFFGQYRCLHLPQ
jgi:hypothetical protein